MGVFLEDDANVEDYTLDFQVYLDPEDFQLEDAEQTVHFYPYRFTSGLETGKTPKQLRGFVVAPSPLNVEIEAGEGVEVIRDSAGIALKHALVYDYFDYGANETRQNVVRLADETLGDGSLAADFYEELWLRAKQLSNDLADLFLLRQSGDGAHYFVNDFAKFGAYGERVSQPEPQSVRLFGVRVLRCPYGYAIEEDECVVDVRLDAYARNEEELAKRARFSFEGSPQLRKKNH